MRFNNLLTNHFYKIVLSSLLLSTSAIADNPNAKFDISKINCWDYTALEDTNRANAASMVFGYVVAKNNVPIQSGASIQATIENATKLCVSNPDMYLSSAIERGLLN